MKNVLTLCGSLRARSSNRALLRAYARLAPSDVVFSHYTGLAELPHFNPDVDHAPAPKPVEELRSLISQADLVVISTPEYAHALPGSFKNALDWLVSDPAFAGKPVVILHVARGSRWALDSLQEVLRTMSARLLDDALVEVPLGSNALDENEILARDDLRALLARSAASVFGSTRS